jgi:sigma-B regulation protein RsbU (phosphoserine phosphatase)
MSTVFIVDDQRDLCDLLRRLFEKAGHPAYCVTDPTQAAAVLRAHPADVVLLDVMMPVVDGFGVLDAIRSDPALATTPVVMYSALSDEGTRMRALAAGANDYIVKGLRFSDIQQRLAPYLSSPPEGSHSFS